MLSWHLRGKIREHFPGEGLIFHGVNVWEEFSDGEMSTGLFGENFSGEFFMGKMSVRTLCGGCLDSVQDYKSVCSGCNLAHRG